MKTILKKSIRILEYRFRIKFINSAGTESEVSLWAIDEDTAKLKAAKYIPAPKILQVQCLDRLKARVFTYKN